MGKLKITLAEKETTFNVSTLGLNIPAALFYSIPLDSILLVKKIQSESQKYVCRFLAHAIKDMDVDFFIIEISEISGEENNFYFYIEEYMQANSFFKDIISNN